MSNTDPRFAHLDDPTEREWLTTPADQAGYICKSCGGPSPLGVGYVDNSAGAAERSAGRTRCDCGQSEALKA